MTDQAALAYEPQVPAKGSRLATIGGLAAVTLLALGAGVAIAWLIATPEAPVAETSEAAAGETAPVNPAAYGAAAGPLTLISLDPVITNIAAPPSAIIRIEASLVLRADAENPEVLAAQIAADTLAFARSLELAQIEGARGLLHLREDLKERAMLRSPAVADVVIHALVAQ